MIPSSPINSARATVSPFYENDTVVVYSKEIYLQDAQYRLDVQIYNVLPQESNWTPPAFLIDNLGIPYLTDNLTAPSSLYLIFNRIFGVPSIVPNDDPFFLTNTSASDFDGLYYYGRRVSTLACRDRYQLRVNPPGIYMPLTTNGSWIATGSWNSVYDAFITSGAEYGADDDLYSDILLFVEGFTPSALNIIYQGLAGNVLNAQKTVIGSIQYGLPQNISTRTEFTRWFGVAILNALNVPSMLTSGIDNDWGYGIEPLPDLFWFCDKTLRISPLHVSVYMLPLILIIVGSIVLTSVSYLLDPFLLFVVMIVYRSSSWTQQIQHALVNKNLHNLLQLHRIAVEGTTKQKFERTAENIPNVRGRDSRDAGYAPIYGVVNVDEYNMMATGYGGADFEDTDSQQLLSVGHEYKEPKLYATMLSLSDMRGDGNIELRNRYSIRDLQ